MWYKSDFLKRATVEQLIFFESVISSFNPTAILSHVYTGPIPESQYLNYDANTLWLAFDIRFASASGAAVNAGFINFMDKTNALFMLAQNNMPIMNGAAINYAYADLFVKNISFSCITATQYSYMRLIGFKLTK